MKIEENELITALNTDSLISQSLAFADSCRLLGLYNTTNHRHEILHVFYVDAIFSIELALKAYLSALQISVPKTHNIDRIVECIPNKILLEIKKEATSNGIENVDLKIILNLKDMYTIQRYNSGCLIIKNEMSLLTFQQVIIKLCRNYIIESEIYRHNPGLYTTV